MSGDHEETQTAEEMQVDGKVAVRRRWLLLKLVLDFYTFSFFAALAMLTYQPAPAKTPNITEPRVELLIFFCENP